MASQTQGIQQLLAAEKKAAEKVSKMKYSYRVGVQLMILFRLKYDLL